jgi:hypothetical protein
MQSITAQEAHDLLSDWYQRKQMIQAAIKDSLGNTAFVFGLIEVFRPGDALRIDLRSYDKKPRNSTTTAFSVRLDDAIFRYELLHNPPQTTKERMAQSEHRMEIHYKNGTACELLVINL